MSEPGRGVDGQGREEMKEIESERERESAEWVRIKAAKAVIWAEQWDERKGRVCLSLGRGSYRRSRASF